MGFKELNNNIMEPGITNQDSKSRINLDKYQEFIIKKIEEKKIKIKRN